MPRTDSLRAWQLRRQRLSVEADPALQPRSQARERSAGALFPRRLDRLGAKTETRMRLATQERSWLDHTMVATVPCDVQSQVPVHSQALPAIRRGCAAQRGCGCRRVSRRPFTGQARRSCREAPAERLEAVLRRAPRHAFDRDSLPGPAHSATGSKSAADGRGRTAVLSVLGDEPAPAGTGDESEKGMAEQHSGPEAASRLRGPDGCPRRSVNERGPQESHPGAPTSRDPAGSHH